MLMYYYLPIKLLLLKTYFAIYSYVKEIGGLVVMDEVQTGLGRMGTWWGFQVVFDNFLIVY